jgi:hypothetical protein
VKAVVSLVALAISGCAWMSEAHVMDRHVSSLEHEQPDREALARDDLHSTQRVLGWMDGWKTRIDTDDGLTQVERARLTDRLDAAQRRYTIAAAEVAGPMAAFTLAQPLLTPEDPTLLPIVRRAVDGITADRQRRAAKAHTYFYDPTGGAEWKETYESDSWNQGVHTDHYEHHELVETPGRCVVGTRPFGPEGTINPTMTLHVVGASPRLYGRCYLRDAPTALSEGPSRLTVTVGHATARITERHEDGDTPYLDFVADGVTDASLPFETLMLEVDYLWDDGEVIGVDDEGNLRPAEQYKHKRLALSAVFWDRDGEARASE